MQQQAMPMTRGKNWTAPLSSSSREIMQNMVK
jgi:hypothetical protein